MGSWLVILVLAAAASLEAGGDAIVRGGLQSRGGLQRAGLIVLGGCVLTLYAVVVNSPALDFGRLLGVYVVLFFLAAQIVNLGVFHVWPGAPVLLGGALIVAGGLVMTVWR